MYRISHDIQHRRFRAPMGEDEIRRWLMRFQYDQEFRNKGRRTVPFVSFCEFAGVSRYAVYDFIRRKSGLSETTRRKLTVAIEEVQAGLRWKRKPDHGYHPVRQYQRMGDVA